MAACIGGALSIAALVVAVRALVPERLYGHYPYRVASEEGLIAVDAAGGVRLRAAAARAFERMRAAAARDGLLLVPLSGHRSLEKQGELFYRGAALKREPLAKRAHVCAPPGFSEHHTGYSVDVGDGAYVDTKLALRFRDTPVYRWMRSHAGRFGFEQSFPQGNAQGIAYEPWHWRWVGSWDSWRTFLPARVGE